MRATRVFRRHPARYRLQSVDRGDADACYFVGSSAENTQQPSRSARQTLSARAKPRQNLAISRKPSWCHPLTCEGQARSAASRLVCWRWLDAHDRPATAPGLSATASDRQRAGRSKSSSSTVAQGIKTARWHMPHLFPNQRLHILYGLMPWRSAQSAHTTYAWLSIKPGTTVRQQGQAWEHRSRENGVVNAAMRPARTKSLRGHQDVNG